MSHSDAGPYEPTRPALLAGAVFLLAAATLCWPMLAGRFLVGDDQYVAGYGFRLFGAEMFRATGRIPEWNPYLFGGLPFVAAQHGDIFYPTAWLRWVLPVDTAMNLGFALHLVLAGATMYAFLRALRVGWAGAMAGGLAYELTGILASLVKPGHDGKLFVSALAPLALLALLRAIRDRRPGGYALLALTVGLCMLSPHYQMTYYLLVAAGLWTIYLVFFDPDRPADIRPPLALVLALGAVLLGLAVAAIQVLPFLAYIPFSPRAAGGPSGGWEYATGFSMPPEEIVGTVLPQFNGVLEHYWGRNFFKLHTEYLGALVVVLALLGLRDRARTRVVRALGVIAILFLLISLGGHTPFYRLWYEVMPMMKKVRAPGMAFFLVALPVAAFAGFGADRLLRREVSPRALLVPLGGLGVLALLAATGALGGLGMAFAAPEQAARLVAGGAALQAGGLRLLVVVALGGAVLWAAGTGALRGALATGAVCAAVVADLWSIDRLFFQFREPASVLFAVDPVTARLRSVPKPYRVLDVGVYQGSYLMAHDVQTMLGYHGVEVRFYDELLGGKNEWRHIGSPNLHDLLAVRFLLVPEEQEVPGFHRVLGPVPTTPGSVGTLLERDTVPPYVRVVPGAARLPDDQIVPTVVDPRFPVNEVVVLPDTASVDPAPIASLGADSTRVRASLAEWAPGRMRISMDGSEQRPLYLVIGETWYPDWHAEVDGHEASVHRGNHALMTVVLPPGARAVTLRFASGEYARGRIVTLLALLVIAGLFGWSGYRRRSAAHG
ncbi:MAG TPA: hypothetical protein VMN37_08285 [Gemmatimonadales bacterium]|nr:hypothetical protein [Gemmatimonadales bacterium]